MDVEMLKAFAAQLKRPSGEMGVDVGKKMNEGNLEINQFTIEALDVQPGDHLLEIGMGNGYFVKNILSESPAAFYAGCDFSELMVDEARKLNMSWLRDGRAEFFQAAADHLPFEDETFHKVFTINTVYFWEEKEKVLSEIRRVLKPGGQVFISIRPLPVMEKLPFVKFGFALFSKEDLVDLLSANGFRIDKVIERQESPMEFSGSYIPMETLIVAGSKI